MPPQIGITRHNSDQIVEDSDIADLFATYMNSITGHELPYNLLLLLLITWKNIYDFKFFKIINMK